MTGEQSSQIFRSAQYALRQALRLTARIVEQPPSIHAQSAPAPNALFQTIEALDTRLFDASNRCDLEVFGAMLVEDLSFITIPAASCDQGKVTRKLVPGTLELYPIANYGALEIGVLRFLHPWQAKTEPDGEAKFIHLWQNSAGVWKLARVISFDHHAVVK